MKYAKTIRIFLSLLIVVLLIGGGIALVTLQLAPLVQRVMQPATPAAESIASSTTDLLARVPTPLPQSDGPSPSDAQSPALPDVATAFSETLAAAVPTSNQTQILVPDDTIDTQAPPLEQETISSRSATDKFFAGDSANAASSMQRATVDAAIANVRSAPSIAGELLVQIQQGTELTVLETSNDDVWHRVCCPLGTVVERESWISADLVRLHAMTPDSDTGLVTGASAAEAARTSVLTSSADGPLGRVNATLVNVRGGPSTDYDVVAQAELASSFALVGRTEQGDWLVICCVADSEQSAWILADLLDIAGDRVAVINALPVVTPPPVPTAVPAPPPVSVTVAAQSTGGGAGLPGSGNFGAPAATNPLTGQPLSGGRGGQRPIIVCVNNDPAARPQLGLSQADIFYEYLMEGYGITRFSAIFYGTDVGQIGPVRSARLVNYYMGALYDAGLVCSGASDQVRYLLKHEAPFPYLDIDLDDPANNRYSASVGSDYRTRLRTSTGGARQWLADWGAERSPALRSLTFGNLIDGGAPATQVTVPYPGGTGSQVAYQYDGSSGLYGRWLGGAPHTDGNSGGQLQFANVIVQYILHEATDIVEDSLGSTSIRLNLFGNGRVLVFRDGKAFVGSWRSESRGDLPRFYTEGGQEIALKPGRSAISIVPMSYAIAYD